MEIPGLQDVLARLKQFEREAGNAPEYLAQIEQHYETLAGQLSQVRELLSQRNEFRVRHAAAMRIKRPRVLYGSRNRVINFHSVPLMRVADVAFLGTGNSPERSGDLIDLDPRTLDIADAVAGQGFQPDLYFDYQVCSSNFFVRGLEKLPCPSVATVCHHFRTFKCEAIAEQFDFLLPLSTRFCELLSRFIDPAKIIDLPFGLSWGSLHHSLTADAAKPRPVDVLLTFPAGDGPIYGHYRTLIAQLFEEAKAKLGGKYRFEMITGVDRNTYVEALFEARIVLNAVGVHGPYNYRTCEIANAGAVLMQFDHRYATGPQYMEKYFTPGEDFVAFDETDFLTKLEALLADPAACVAMAKRAQTKLVNTYSYEQLYTRLIAELDARTGWKERRASQEQAALRRVEGYIAMPSETRTAAILDLAVAGKGAHPASLLMPIYKSLAGITPEIIEQVVGPIPRISDPAARALAVYDAALRAIPNPSLVDRFNHLVLSAEEGRIRTHDCRQILEEANTAPLSRAEIKHIVAPEVPDVDKSLAEYAQVAVLNLGYLLSKDDLALQQAARDFMVLWCCLLLDLAEAATDQTRQTVENLLNQYRVCEDSLPLRFTRARTGLARG